MSRRAPREPRGPLPGPVIACFVDVATPILRDVFDQKKLGACVNATRITVAALAAFRIAARPVSVRFLCMNRIYFERARAEGRLPRQDDPNADGWWESGAWAVGIDTSPRPNEPNAWPGHLTAIVPDGTLIDASAGQFRREDRGLPMPDVFALSRHRARARVLDRWRSARALPVAA